MLTNKVILITGASKGIGKATALLCAKNNANVVVNYNNSKKEAKDVADTIVKQGFEVSIFKADVSKEKEVKEMFNKISKKYGRLDILVNNAGIIRRSLLVITQEKDFDDVMNINAKGTFLCMRYAAKIMTKQKSGKIVNVSSIVGSCGGRGLVAYSASKAAIIGMTKAAAKELGAYGITVNAVAPGVVQTEMMQGVDHKTKQSLVKQVALGRVAEPQDVARVILFLSADLGNYVSGQIIGVDGCQVTM